MRKPTLLRRAQTIFSDPEWTGIQEFLKRRKMKMYTFLKWAALAAISGETFEDYSKRHKD